MIRPARPTLAEVPLADLSLTGCCLGSRGSSAGEPGTVTTTWTSRTHRQERARRDIAGSAGRRAGNDTLLRCRDGSLYTGITNDLPKRLKAHAAGTASRYTTSPLPGELAYEEPLPTKARALKRQAAIKRLPRRAELVLIPSPRPDTRGRPSQRP